VSTAVSLFATVALIIRLLIVLLSNGDCTANQEDVLTDVVSSVLFVGSLGFIGAGHRINTVKLFRDLLVACGLVGIRTTLRLAEHTGCEHTGCEINVTVAVLAIVGLVLVLLAGSFLSWWKGFVYGQRLNLVLYEADWLILDINWLVDLFVNFQIGLSFEL
jgi:hypothetical protein